SFTFLFHNPFFSLPSSSLNYNTHSFYKYLFFYMLGMPNVVFIFHIIPFLGHVWTIGVEEQFYAIWPVILRYSKNVIATLIGLTLTILLFKILLYYFNS